MPNSSPKPPKVTAGMLQSHPLFRGVSPDTLLLAAEELQARIVQPGEHVMAEGDLAADMYVIVTGELEVLTHGDQGNLRVALLGPGDWVGEMAILELQPRSATVRSLAPSLLLRMTTQDVKHLFQDRDPIQYGTLVRNVAQELSRRLRVADRLIANSGATLAQRYIQESMRPPAL